METTYLKAEINIKAILDNIYTLKTLSSGQKFCAVVKSNAYGHNIEIVAPAISDVIDMFAVANFNEAQKLLDVKIAKPILVLGSEFSLHNEQVKLELSDWIVQNNLRITPMLIEDLEILAQSAARFHRPALLHLDLDTGMSRMGYDEKGLTILLDYILANKYLKIEGIYTHPANADEAENSFSKQQHKRLRDFVEMVRQLNVQVPLVHGFNSASIAFIDNIGFNMVRPGISIYGYQPSVEGLPLPHLKPAMKVISYLSVVKGIKAGCYVGYGCSYQAKNDMTIGTVPIGYADGYDRRLSNKGQMIIDDVFVPVIGRVSMDQTVVDLSVLVNMGREIQAGQEVVIIDDDINSPNSIESIGKQIGSIPYEIVTKLGNRIKRVSKID
jgi:alanine racemase